MSPSAELELFPAISAFHQSNGFEPCPSKIESDPPCPTDSARSDRAGTYPSRCRERNWHHTSRDAHPTRARHRREKHLAMAPKPVRNSRESSVHFCAPTHTLRQNLCDITEHPSGRLHSRPAVAIDHRRKMQTAYAPPQLRTQKAEKQPAPSPLHTGEAMPTNLCTNHAKRTVVAFGEHEPFGKTPSRTSNEDLTPAQRDLSLATTLRLLNSISPMLENVSAKPLFFGFVDRSGNYPELPSSCQPHDWDETTGTRRISLGRTLVRNTPESGRLTSHYSMFRIQASNARPKSKTSHRAPNSLRNSQHTESGSEP